eukprot:scpid92005/ scgid25830/ 
MIANSSSCQGQQGDIGYSCLSLSTINKIAATGINEGEIHRTSGQARDSQARNSHRTSGQARNSHTGKPVLKHGQCCQPRWEDTHAMRQIAMLVALQVGDMPARRSSYEDCRGQKSTRVCMELARVSSTFRPVTCTPHLHHNHQNNNDSKRASTTTI